MSSPGYTLRRFRPGSRDLSDIATVCSLGSIHDELAKYLTQHMLDKWASFRAHSLRYFQGQLARPDTVCFVVEDGATRALVGWAIWTRHGTSAAAAAWRAPNATWARWLDRALLKAQDKYYAHVPNANPTRNRRAWRELAPAMAEEWPADVMTEFWSLDGLGVDPEHYRKGIGRMLVRWGLEQGKEEGVCVTVYASPMGRHLYESVGFEVVHRQTAFDAYVPEFEAPDGLGAWAMAWQCEGGDEVERCRRRYAEEDEKKDEGKEKNTAEPAEASAK